jgi:hypothetical protein
MEQYDVLIPNPLRHVPLEGGVPEYFHVPAGGVLQNVGEDGRVLFTLHQSSYLDFAPETKYHDELMLSAISHELAHLRRGLDTASSPLGITAHKVELRRNTFDVGFRPNFVAKICRKILFTALLAVRPHGRHARIPAPTSRDHALWALWSCPARSDLYAASLAS